MTRTAVITGAGSGIGLATAEALAAAQWSVVATVRHPERADSLQERASRTPGMHVAALDVTDDESVTSCIGAVTAEYGGIDLLVNNAGGGYRGTLEQLTVAEMQHVMDLNFFGVVRATKAVLPGMRAARSGRIITVTSLNGVVALPFSDAYNAAKFAVEGLMESLAAVMREFGVSISVLEPGPVHTAFFARTGGRAHDVAQDDPYRELVTRFNERLMALGAGGQSAASVAEVIVQIAADPSPALRYQSSEEARALAGRKLVDTTGSSVVAATSELFRS